MSAGTTAAEKKIDVIVDVDEHTTHRAARCSWGKVLRVASCALLLVVLGATASFAAGVYQLVHSTALEPRTINIIESARAPQTAVDITVGARVTSFPAQLSILLESAQCGLVGNDKVESIALEFVSGGLLVASRSHDYSPTAMLSVASIAALRAQLAVWKATSATPQIECRAAAKLGVLASPAFVPVTIGLAIDTNAEAAPLSFDGLSLGGGAIRLRASAAFRLDDLLTPTLGPLVKGDRPSSPLATLLHAMRGVAFDRTGWSAGLVRGDDGLVSGAAVTSGPAPLGPDAPVGQIKLSTNLQTELVSGSVEYHPPAVALARLKAAVPTLRHVFVSQSVLTMTVRTTSAMHFHSSTTAAAAAAANGTVDSEWVAHVAATLRPAAPVVDLWEVTGAAQPPLPIGFAFEGYDPASGGKGTFWPRKRPPMANALAAGPTTAANRLDVAGDVVTEGFLGQLLAALAEAPRLHREGAFNFDEMGASVDGLLAGAAARAPYLASTLHDGMEATLGEERAAQVRRHLLEWAPPSVSGAVSDALAPLSDRTAGRALQTNLVDPIDFSYSGSNLLGTGISIAVSFNYESTDVRTHASVDLSVPIDPEVQLWSDLGISTFGVTTSMTSTYGSGSATPVTAAFNFQGKDAWATEQYSFDSSTTTHDSGSSPSTTTGTIALGGDIGTLAFTLKPYLNTCAWTTFQGHGYSNTDCSGTPYTSWSITDYGMGSFTTNDHNCYEIDNGHSVRGEFCDMAGVSAGLPPVYNGVFYYGSTSCASAPTQFYYHGTAGDGSCVVDGDNSFTYQCSCSYDPSSGEDIQGAANGPLRLQLTLTPTSTSVELGTQPIEVSSSFAWSNYGNVLANVKVEQGTQKVEVALTDIVQGADAYGPPAFSLLVNKTNVDWIEDTYIWSLTTWDQASFFPLHVVGDIVLSSGTPQQSNMHFNFTEWFSEYGSLNLAWRLTPSPGFTFLGQTYQDLEYSLAASWVYESLFPLAVWGYWRDGAESIQSYLNVNAGAVEGTDGGYFSVSGSLTPHNVAGLETTTWSLQPYWSSSGGGINADFGYGIGTMAVQAGASFSETGASLGATLTPTNVEWLAKEIAFGLQPTWTASDIIPIGLTGNFNYGASTDPDISVFMIDRVTLTGTDGSGSLTAEFSPTRIEWLPHKVSFSLNPYWDTTNGFPLGATSDITHGTSSVNSVLAVSFPTETSGSLSLTITPTDVAWMEATSITITPGWDNYNVFPITVNTNIIYGEASCGITFYEDFASEPASILLQIAPNKIDWMVPTTVSLSSITWSEWNYVFRVVGKVSLADGSPDNTFNVFLAPATGSSDLEILSSVVAQVAAVISWIAAYAPPSPPPPFPPVESGGATVDVVKVKVIVAGTVAEWDTAERKTAVRQAFADRQTPPLPLAAISLEVRAASRRRLESSAAAQPLSHRELQSGVELDLSIIASTPTVAAAIASDVNTNLAQTSAMTTMIAAAVPDATVTVLEVAPTTTETVVLTAAQVAALPAEYQAEIGVEADAGGVPIGAIAAGAGGGFACLIILCCYCYIRYNNNTKGAPPKQAAAAPKKAAAAPKKAAEATPSQAVQPQELKPQVVQPQVVQPQMMTPVVQPQTMVQGAAAAPMMQTQFPMEQTIMPMMAASPPMVQMTSTPPVVSMAPPVSQAAKFCPHCGSPSVPGAKFCSKCGSAIPVVSGYA